MDSCEFLGKVQWRYFDLPHQIFKEEIGSVTDRHSRIGKDTDFYRSVLYAFVTYREFIEFEFVLSLGDHQNNQSVAIEVIFCDPQIKKDFFTQVLDNLGLCGRNVKNQARELNEFVSNFFFELLNDLYSVTQPNGFNLFPYIHPPMLVQRYYNVMAVSKALLEEYNRIKMERGEFDSSASSLIGYIHGFKERPSDDLLKAVWQELGNPIGIPEQTFLAALSRKLVLHRADFCKEMKYLIEKSDTNKSGPTLSKFNPAFLKGRNPNYGSSIPTFMRFFSDSRESKTKLKNFLTARKLLFDEKPKPTFENRIADVRTDNLLQPQINKDAVVQFEVTSSTSLSIDGKNPKSSVIFSAVKILPSIENSTISTANNNVPDDSITENSYEDGLVLSSSTDTSSESEIMTNRAYDTHEINSQSGITQILSDEEIYPYTSAKTWYEKFSSKVALSPVEKKKNFLNQVSNLKDSTDISTPRSLFSDWREKSVADKKVFKGKTIVNHKKNSEPIFSQIGKFGAPKVSLNKKSNFSIPVKSKNINHDDNLESATLTDVTNFSNAKKHKILPINEKNESASLNSHSSKNIPTLSSTSLNSNLRPIASNKILKFQDFAPTARIQNLSKKLSQEKVNGSKYLVASGSSSDIKIASVRSIFTENSTQPSTSFSNHNNIIESSGVEEKTFYLIDPLELKDVSDTFQLKPMSKKSIEGMKYKIEKGSSKLLTSEKTSEASLMNRAMKRKLVRENSELIPTNIALDSNNSAKVKLEHDSGIGWGESSMKRQRMIEL